jgi:hypothetical protein
VDLHPGVVGIFMSFGPVSGDDQLVIAISLDVKVAFLREANDFHGQVMWDAVIKDDLAAGRTHLGALVTDDRAVEAETLNPRHRARERPPGARDHLHPGGDDLMQGVDITRVEVEASVDDGAVEVEGKKAIPGPDRYLLTSGLSRFGGRPPRTAVAMLRAAIADISERVLVVALAM